MDSNICANSQVLKSASNESSNNKDIVIGKIDLHLTNNGDPQVVPINLDTIEIQNLSEISESDLRAIIRFLEFYEGSIARRPERFEGDFPNYSKVVRESLEQVSVSFSLSNDAFVNCDPNVILFTESHQDIAYKTLKTIRDSIAHASIIFDKSKRAFIGYDKYFDEEESPNVVAYYCFSYDLFMRVIKFDVRRDISNESISS